MANPTPATPQSSTPEPVLIHLRRLREGAFKGACSAGRSRSEAEDIAQQVVASVLARPDGLASIRNRDKSSYGWAAGRKMGISVGNRLRREVITDPAEWLDLAAEKDVALTEDQVVDMMVANEIEKIAQNELTPQQLRDFYGYKNQGFHMGDAIKFLSEQLDEPDQNIRKRLDRAIKKIRTSHDAIYKDER